MNEIEVILFFSLISHANLALRIFQKKEIIKDLRTNKSY